MQEGRDEMQAGGKELKETEAREEDLIFFSFAKKKVSLLYSETSEIHWRQERIGSSVHR